MPSKNLSAVIINDFAKIFSFLGSYSQAYSSASLEV
jgi:hypothetical protein